MKRRIVLISVISFLIILGIVFIRFFNSKLLSKEILEESLQIGTQFLLNNQKSGGNFNYDYDFVTKKLSTQDSQVRQAGALWGVSLIHAYQPSKETYDALIKGFAFFDSISVQVDSLNSMIKYPGTSAGRTGTQALLALAYLEFLTTDLDSNTYNTYREKFDQYFRFILSQRSESGLFYMSYSYKNLPSKPTHSPYFDGESLLLLTKSANYLKIDSLKPMILESAEAMYQKYVVEARKIDPDSKETKGFYQWSSMAFFEIYKMGWDDIYAERIIELAYWMIDTHRTLYRTKNTAYAHEGMITAWKAAEMTENENAQKKIGFVIDKGLYKLTKWQVGHSIQNNFIDKNFDAGDQLAYGGIMNCKDCPGLRIDVTQHQMHAVILALKYVYKD